MRTIRVNPKAPKRMKSVPSPGQPPPDPVPKSSRLPSMAPTVQPPSTRNYGKVPPSLPGINDV